MANSPLLREGGPSTVADERYGFARCETVYRFAGHHSHDRRVLDLMDSGCGQSYGSALLAQRAAWVLGVSADARVIAQATEDFPALRVALIMPGQSLPCDDAGVDLVTCGDLFTPFWQTPRLLTEFFRVLRPGGQLICAVANRRTVPGDGTDDSAAHPAASGTTARQLQELLTARFKVDALLGLHHGWRLSGVERLLGGPLPDLLSRQPPPLWPRWVRSAVHRVHPSDFSLRADRLDEALDLVVLATRR